MRSETDMNYESPRGRRPRRHCKLVRFFRGYLMTVGGLTTFYVLVQLIVKLLVEAEMWLPSDPLL